MVLVGSVSAPWNFPACDPRPMGISLPRPLRLFSPLWPCPYSLIRAALFDSAMPPPVQKRNGANCWRSQPGYSCGGLRRPFGFPLRVPHAPYQLVGGGSGMNFAIAPGRFFRCLRGQDVEDVRHRPIPTRTVVTGDHVSVEEQTDGVAIWRLVGVTRLAQSNLYLAVGNEVVLKIDCCFAFSGKNYCPAHDYCLHRLSLRCSRIHCFSPLKFMPKKQMEP